MNFAKIYTEPFAGMQRNDKISLISAIILVGFTISVFFHYVRGAYLGQPYPYNTFLFTPASVFTDFLILYDINTDLNPYLGGIPGGQYPLLNMFCHLFTIFPRSISPFLYSILIILFFIYLNAVNLYSKNRYESFRSIFIFSFLTYPFIFTIDRGNLESLLFIFMMLFIVFFLKEKFIVSSLFLSTAIAMKLFPAAFLILYLGEKKYKEIVITVITAIVLTLICLMFFKGGLHDNLLFLIQGSNIKSNPIFSSFLGNNNCVQRGVTLFTFFKVIFIQTNTIRLIDMSWFLTIYTRIAIISFFIIGAYVIYLEQEMWKKVSLIVFAMLLLPQFSADYKLIHLFIPIILFINNEKRSKLDLLYCAMFGLLLIPKDYYLLKRIVSDLGVGDISIAVLINPLIMMLISGMIIITGLKDWLRNRKKIRYI